MNLSDEIDLEDYIASPDRVSGADINSICQEVRVVFLHHQRLGCMLNFASFFVFKDCI